MLRNGSSGGNVIGALLNGRYRLDGELGRGGMGVVYHAHDTLLDRPVAVKVLSQAGLGIEGGARLLREAQAAARLNHPNIVSVYDAGETQGQAFIVMELIKGESLYARRPQSLDETLAIVRQLCAALDHAHANGIVHRDLKPENVLVLPASQTGDGLAGRVKLMDFGLARSAASRLSFEGAIVGSVFYLAPEQARGEAIDGRADLYALGVMLYELTTGRLPFVADDPIAVISQHLHAPVVPPRAHNELIPPALDTLIVRLMSKRPEERPASASEVLLALERPDAAQAEPAVTGELSLLDRIVRGRLVGREHELSEASIYWQRAASGEGQLLLISGEPGIGKTRLVRELATRVEVSGGQVLVGECYAEGGAPYAPAAQIIRAASDQPGFQNLAGLPDLLTLAPDLLRNYPDIPPRPPLDPESEQQRLFESVVELCTALAVRAPLLLFIDDAHWADGGTLSLLRHLARRLRKQRVMLAVTYREVELEEARPLHEVLLDLNRERLATRLKLSRLSRDQTRDLLAAMFAEDITPDFLDGIYHETEGNPFFVEEVCRALIESGKLTFAGGRWRRPPDMAEMEIPQSVRVAIQARVGKLPLAAQESLLLAAILGREFDFETLLRAGERDEDALIEALEAAERAQLIEEVKGKGVDVYAFIHALIPATLSDGVSGRRRRRLHRHAAEAIEAVRPHDYEALAHHFTEADEADKAIEYSRRAATRAKDVYAYDAAIQQLRAALDLIEPGERGAARLALLEELADIFQVLHDGKQAIALYHQALDVWRAIATADAMTAVRLHGKIVEAFIRLTWQADVQQFEGAAHASREVGLKLIEGQPPHREIVRLLTTLSYGAWVHRVPMDWEAAEHYAQAAVAMGERVDALVELSAALDALAKVYGARGLFRERVDIALRRLALSRDPRFGDARERVDILNQAGAALLYVGEHAQAMPYLVEAEELAGQIRAVDQQAFALRSQSYGWYLLDRWDHVLEIEDKWRALQKRHLDYFDRAGALCFQIALNASVHARRGDFERAHALREESYAIMLAADGAEGTWGRSNHY